ncbi:hypothetical protein CBS147326_41 [Penicillium roqueforti]|nr:hypothetical protein CBS147326_41 [Penicillium roqueforti]KAI3168079.1 hypothetical protein DTO046C5_4337 [Penicillium roqueforti]
MDNHQMNYVQQLSHYATADIHRVKKAWEAVVSVEPMFHMADIYDSILHSLIRSRFSVQQCLSLEFPAHMREKILTAGNSNSTSSFTCNSGQTISSLFQYSTWHNASEISIQAGEKALTYTQLAERVDKITSVITLLVPAGAVIAVLADRSSNWIVGMLAAMQANTVYCPVDASYPEEYRAQLLERSGAQVLLLPNTSQMEKTGPNGPLTLAIDHILNKNIKPADFQPRLPQPSSTAYLCFTSGSTGQPKGVLCRHRGVVALYSSVSARPTSRPSTRIGQMLSPGFDGCIHEILSTVCSGGTLVLPRGKDDKFSHLSDVDVATLTPSLAGELDPRDYPNLKSIHFGGEPVPDALVERWASDRELYNIYGPTEVLWPILSINLNNQPMLTIGEIYIAGVQISRGYLGIEKKTTEEIVPDPFCEGFGQEMMYRSGDIGFLDEHGNLHCCSRDDRQVKLRGYRINLDDIPAVVYRTMCSVSKAVAVTENGAVVLWVEPEIDTELLRRQLAVALPPHSAPKSVYSMTKLPLTKNGKFDIKGLVSNNHVKLVPKSSQPLNSLEETLAGIWRQLLTLDSKRQISSADDFAVLGGHSLLQLALAARIKSLFNIPITVKDIISASTLRDLARLIQTQGESQDYHSQAIKFLGKDNNNLYSIAWSLSTTNGHMVTSKIPFLSRGPMIALRIRYEYDTDALPTTIIDVVKSLVLRCLERMLDNKVLMLDLRSEIEDLFGAECHRQGLLRADVQRLGRAFLVGV